LPTLRKLSRSIASSSLKKSARYLSDSEEWEPPIKNPIWEIFLGCCECVTEIFAPKKITSSQTRFFFIMGFAPVFFADT